MLDERVGGGGVAQVEQGVLGDVTAVGTGVDASGRLGASSLGEQIHQLLAPDGRRAVGVQMGARQLQRDPPSPLSVFSAKTSFSVRGLGSALLSAIGANNLGETQPL